MEHEDPVYRNGLAGPDDQPEPGESPRSMMFGAGFAGIVLSLLFGLVPRALLPCQFESYPVIRIVLLSIACGLACGLGQYYGYKWMGLKRPVLRDLLGLAAMMLILGFSSGIAPNWGQGLFYGTLIALPVNAFLDSTPLGAKPRRFRIISAVLAVIALVLFVTLFSMSGGPASVGATC